MGEDLIGDRYYGFNPFDLIQCGALQEENCEPANLTGEIHSLLHHDHFYNLPEDLYDYLKPVWLLVTRLLTEPFLMGFWATLLMGRRELDEEVIENAAGLRRHRIVEEKLVDHETYLFVSQYLDDIGAGSNLVSYEFGSDLTRPPENKEMSFAVTSNNYLRDFIDYVENYSDFADTMPSKRQNIFFDKDFYIGAVKMMRTKNRDVNAELRMFAHFAIVVTHEVSRSLNKYCVP